MQASEGVARTERLVSARQRRLEESLTQARNKARTPEQISRAFIRNMISELNLGSKYCFEQWVIVQNKQSIGRVHAGIESYGLAVTWIRCCQQAWLRTLEYASER
eukprot:6189660-Pleurochrysis_carterae.AAC.2